MTRSLLAVVVVFIATVSSALASSAGSPGLWTRVTEANGRNIDEVGLSRTNDGVLHVFWKRRKGSLEESIVHTPISVSGKVGSASPVLGAFKAAGNPAAVTLPDGKLRVFFPGLGDTNADGGVKAATAPPSGTQWTREGIRVSSTVSAVSPIGAAVTKDGESIFAYSYSFHLAFHVGIDPGVTDTEIQPDQACCDYFPGLATDAASGQTVIAWYSNARNRVGLWAQQILPTAGPRKLVPGSAEGKSSLAIDQQTPIASRLGAPGVYIAYCSGYPTCKRALLWRTSGGKAVLAGASADVEDVNIATAPSGRLWVMWHDGGTNELFATRTNKAATRFGPVIKVKPPVGASEVWKLRGEGSGGPLDVLASVSTGTPLATWHTQIWPTLTISVKKTSVGVTFLVTDAGDPMAAAKVSYAGKKLTTNAKGQAKSAPAKSRTRATATKAGYTAATINVG